MPAAESALYYAQLLVAVLVILGIVKSLYNGALHEIYHALQRIPKIEHQLTHLTNAVIALYEATDREDVEVDPTRARKRLTENGPDEYLRDANHDRDFLRGGGGGENDDENGAPAFFPND